jgi:hypothetical protein
MLHKFKRIISFDPAQLRIIQAKYGIAKRLHLRRLCIKDEALQLAGTPRE